LAIPKIILLGPDLIAIAQRPQNDAVVAGVEQHGPLATIEDDARDPDSPGSLHRLANDREGLLADLGIGHEVMRGVVPDPADRRPGREGLDIDRPGAFQRDGIEFVIVQHDVFVIALGIAFDLVVIGTGLPVTASTNRLWIRFPVFRLSVWNRTFSLSERAGIIATGHVTSDSFR
jgi:hypothetical protein